MSSTKKPNAQNSKGRSGSEEPLQQPLRQHAGDTAAVVAGRKRRLHRHDLVANESIEARKDGIIERTAAARVGSLKEHRPRMVPVKAALDRISGMRGGGGAAPRRRRFCGFARRMLILSRPSAGPPYCGRAPRPRVRPAAAPAPVCELGEPLPLGVPQCEHGRSDSGRASGRRGENGEKADRGLAGF